jgi:transposase
MFDEDADLVVAHVRATSRARSRCGLCGRRSPGHDTGEGRRRLAGVGPGHGPRGARGRRSAGGLPATRGGGAAVPWARNDAGHTRGFDETVAWLATQSSKSTVTALMRIAWRTVGSIITRAWDDVDANCDRLAGLRRIGIDEISHKRGHKYLMVVVDHDTRRMVWARASLLWLTPSRRHGRSRCRSRRWSRSLGWRSTGSRCTRSRSMVRLHTRSGPARPRLTSACGVAPPVGPPDQSDADH